MMDAAHVHAISANPSRIIYRHHWVTRVLHWTNALCVFLVLMSGLQIFNAHPSLYWGKFGSNHDPAALQIDSSQDASAKQHGFVRVGHLQLATTGVLGVSRDSDGRVALRGFPSWATIPSYQDLASGRRWHFFFAWMLVGNSALYLLASFMRRHIQRDLWPPRKELQPAHLWKDVRDHLRLRFPTGEAARHYNVLQKLTYVIVIFVLAPTMLATGLTMSPGFDAAAPWLLELFGGRQSARALHFITAMLIALFIQIHLVMIVLAGPVNEVRSMITGRYRLPPERAS